MEIKGIYNTNDNRPGSVPSLSTAPLSTKQVRDEVRNAIANLKAKGIPDWQILSAWSEIAQEQGNYAAADTLASAAFELGKPVE
jgi:hypothetical protein